MRILRVAQTLYPGVTGGGAYHVHAMSRDQAAMGHDVTVMTVREQPDQPHVEERAGYTVVRFDAIARLLGNALSVGLARYLHAADGFDVIHAHSHLYASTNLAALNRYVGDTPLAITNHGLYSQTAPKAMFEAYLRTIGRWTFEQADLVFCYTEVDEQRLRDLGVTTTVAVVPNGVDTQRFRPDGPESDLLDADGQIVLFVGRLVDGKRPQDALASMVQVRKSIPDATLALCGDGPLREELERRARSQRNGPATAEGERVGSDSTSASQFLGHVDYDEMPDVYRAADLLVLPSRAEGMPRTVLEARASGIPVVTTDLDHVASLDDPGVRTVPVGDVDALAECVVETLEAGARKGDHRDGSALAIGDVASDGAVDDGTASDGAVSDSTASDGGFQTQRSAQMAPADTRDATTAREDHDWRSTVRRTTRALESLLDDAPPRS
ncbi:glycosyltransferase family 4 protein [Salinarchaeum chitinilyticum]